MNGLSILKLCQLSNGDLLFLYACLQHYNVRKPRMTKLARDVRTWGTLPKSRFYGHPGVDEK